MGQGLRIFDASGVEQLNSAHFVGRILGVATISTSDGSFVDAGLADGTPFWVFQRDGGGIWDFQPTITVVGTTLSWAWGGWAVGAAGKLVYGIR